MDDHTLDPKPGDIRWIEVITGTGRRQRWTAETEARIIDYLALRENRRRSRREVRPDLWSAISSISILGAVLALLVVPALYSLWFAARSDETLDAHIIQADLAEPLTGKWNRSGSLPNNEVRRGETPPSSYFTAQKSRFRQSTANGLQTRYLTGRRHDQQLLDSPNCWPSHG